jgi:hypothetical protein
LFGEIALASDRGGRRRLKMVRHNYFMVEENAFSPSIAGAPAYQNGTPVTKRRLWAPPPMASDISSYRWPWYQGLLKEKTAVLGPGLDLKV